MISTCEQAEFDALSYQLNPPRVRPALDVIGPEAQAVANLVASKRVLDTLGAYNSALSKLVRAQRELNAMVLSEGGAGSEAERTAFTQRRRALVGTRDALLLELKKAFGDANAAMRKDLNIEAIDWVAYENTAGSQPTQSEAPPGS